MVEKITHKRKFDFLLALKISFSIDLFTLSETLSESTNFLLKIQFIPFKGTKSFSIGKFNFGENFEDFEA